MNNWLFLSLITCGVVIGGQGNGEDMMSFSLENLYEDLSPYSGASKWSSPPEGFNGKVFSGYQGWFTCAGDGSGIDWVHYGEEKFAAGTDAGIEFWPDMSEFDEDEKYLTPYRYEDGSPAYLFSSFNAKTVNRHFLWMKEYGIDVAFFQRFLPDLNKPEHLFIRNQVLQNVRSGAHQNGVAWCIMYDLSGASAGDIENVLIPDWKHLCDRMKVREDGAYQRVDGKPLIGIWGVGFNDNRKYTLEETEKLIRFLKDDPVYGGNTVLVGTPSYWREKKQDALPDPKLHDVLLQADIISPWSVGRYSSPDGVEKHAASLWRPDIELTRQSGKKYLPVVFPGFSWVNLQKMYGNTNQVPHVIPRLRGKFLWKQAIAARDAGAESVYVAMFDELDEGTAIFKISNHSPRWGDMNFLSLEEGIPSDYYLRVVGNIHALYRGQISASADLSDLMDGSDLKQPAEKPTKSENTK